MRWIKTHLMILFNRSSPSTGRRERTKLKFDLLARFVARPTVDHAPVVRPHVSLILSAGQRLHGQLYRVILPTFWINHLNCTSLHQTARICFLIGLIDSNRRRSL